MLFFSNWMSQPITNQTKNQNLVKNKKLRACTQQQHRQTKKEAHPWLLPSEIKLNMSRKIKEPGSKVRLRCVPNLTWFVCSQALKRCGVWLPLEDYMFCLCGCMPTGQGVWPQTSPCPCGFSWLALQLSLWGGSSVCMWRYGPCCVFHLC